MVSSAKGKKAASQPTTSSQKTTSKSNKAAIAVGAVGLVAASGVAGYALKTVTIPTTAAEPTYEITYYQLRKAKQFLSELPVRADAEITPEYDVNGFVSDDWKDTNDSGCPTRYDVLVGSMKSATGNTKKCEIYSGRLFDYYTGKIVTYKSGIDIDHVVSKKNAWDSGGYAWDEKMWEDYANDEKRVLLATSASANRSKGDRDAADWLPENEDFWCRYVVKQIEIKHYYDLSVRQPEKERMEEVLANNCETK